MTVLASKPGYLILVVSVIVTERTIEKEFSLAHSFGGFVNHGSKNMVDQSYSTHGNQETERRQEEVTARHALQRHTFSDLLRLTRPQFPHLFHLSVVYSNI
jgi:hypothetical protein